jgi:hypothetical protein
MTRCLGRCRTSEGSRWERADERAPPELVPSGLLRHGDCDDGEAIDANEVGGVAGIYR